MKVLVIPADRNLPFRIEDLPEGGDTQLEAMQKIVGGFIQLVPTPTDQISLFCNEEGKMMNLHPNDRASELWERIWNQTIWEDYLAGDVFVAGPADDEGNQLPVPDAIVQLMTQLAK